MLSVCVCVCVSVCRGGMVWVTGLSQCFAQWLRRSSLLIMAPFSHTFKTNKQKKQKHELPLSCVTWPELSSESKHTAPGGSQWATHKHHCYRFIMSSSRLSPPHLYITCFFLFLFLYEIKGYKTVYMYHCVELKLSPPCLRLMVLSISSGLW